MCKKVSKERKIMETTDGYFTQNDKITKKRLVVIVKQRKRDGALAVAKIHTPEGKNPDNFVQGVVLKANEHSSLKQDSVVNKHVVVGTKGADKTYKPIYYRDFTDTGDKVTKNDQRKILKGAGGKNKQHQKTEKTKIKRWQKGFKK